MVEGSSPHPLLGSCRLILTGMVFLGVYHLMALRFNLSIALVCMTTDPTHNRTNHSMVANQCQEVGGQEEEDVRVVELHEEEFVEEEEREFQWSKKFQGDLLSSFFYGYILTQLIGGWCSDRWGGKAVFLVGMTILTSTSLFIPLLARIEPNLLLLIRLVQGLASGLAFPSLYNLFTSWTSPGERATLMSIAYAGIPTATVATFPLSSWLCRSGIDGGWPLAFYVPGATGLLWCLAFHLLVYSRPQDHPRISSEERRHLKAPESKETKKLKVPWMAMLASPAVHALWITHLCSAFGYYLIVINISLFIREALGFHVINNGLLSMLPSLGMLLFTVTGKLFDLLRSRAVCSVTNLRKWFNTLGFIAPAACFLCLGLLPCHLKAAHVLMLTFGLSIHELCITGGFYFSHSELAGPYSGILFGITNTFAQIPGFLTPLLVSEMTQNGSLAEWYQVFQLAGIVYLVGAAAYLLWGQAELQGWAAVEKEDFDDPLDTSNLIKNQPGKPTFKSDDC